MFAPSQSSSLDQRPGCPAVADLPPAARIAITDEKQGRSLMPPTKSDRLDDLPPSQRLGVRPHRAQVFSSWEIDCECGWTGGGSTRREVQREYAAHKKEERDER